MTSANLKAELRSIAEKLSDSASYGDAMYEIYVRIKAAAGSVAASEGRTISHHQVKRRFGK